MLFRELLKKEFLTEESLRRQLKITYNINLNLIKKSNEENKEEPVQQNNTQEQPANQQPLQQEVPAQPEQMQVQQQTTDMTSQPITASNALPSVVTEDEIEVRDENKIIRKVEGEIVLSDKQKDMIQSFDDIISELTEEKNNGEPVLDEFSEELIRLLYGPNVNDINQKIDKGSSIFVEIFYGYKKEDGVGVRFNKRKASESVTSTMLIDNEIISVPFSIARVNKMIVDLRNSEFSN